MLPFFLAIDFMNFTYTTNPCPQNVPVAVRMRKGEFSYVQKITDVEFILHVDSITQGSLQPGMRQAVVVMACDFPLGGTAAAYVFDERGKNAVLLDPVASANWGADWGCGPDSIKVRFASRVLRVQQCSDSHSRTKRTNYVLRNGRLIRH